MNVLRVMLLLDDRLAPHTQNYSSDLCSNCCHAHLDSTLASDLSRQRGGSELDFRRLWHKQVWEVTEALERTCRSPQGSAQSHIKSKCDLLRLIFLGTPAVGDGHTAARLAVPSSHAKSLQAIQICKSARRSKFWSSKLVPEVCAQCSFRGSSPSAGPGEHDGRPTIYDHPFVFASTVSSDTDLPTRTSKLDNLNTRAEGLYWINALDMALQIPPLLKICFRSSEFYQQVSLSQAGFGASLGKIEYLLSKCKKSQPPGSGV